MGIYDPNKDGEISFTEFIEVLKKDMSEARKRIVKQSFDLLDTAGMGAIPLEDLLKKYNPRAHPRVKTREKTPEEVKRDFEKAITSKAVNGMINFDGFFNYYLEINATMPGEKEALFIDLVVNTWDLKEATLHVTPAYMEKLETILYEKIRQRTGSKEDEGKALLKAMRYVDSKNTGTLTIEEFSKMMINIGCVMKPEDVQALFYKFDTDCSGKVCCEKVANYFALKGSGSNPNVVQKFKVEPEPPNQVLAKIKKTLNERGSYGIRGLGILFRRMDNSGNRKIDRHEFTWALKENGHTLSSLELERLFKYFDRNNDGVIDINEFLRGIRGELNDRRRSAVYEAFRKLDVTGDGKVTLDDIEQLYKVESHPKFISGQKTKKEILEEFLGQWDTIKKDGIVTIEEFEDYYKDVSASIDRDDYFELMIRNAWKLPEPKAKGKEKTVTFKEEERHGYDENAAAFFGEV
eukprot:TRINITY_DN836_c0_g1_i2.p1 TRINITY_DN836_c0_g1~~TRINITY_DN836_c0_g1_i2.p1  ORF type:complete len:464 (+),score=102.69 TRINITY_DN836_c0_g1_i2:203-1594(+)